MDDSDIIAQNHEHNRRQLAAEAVKSIASGVLGLQTLEARNMDSLDFHEFAVWEIKRALVDAYIAGAKVAE